MRSKEQNRRIIDLMCDTDFTYRPDTNTWSHRDGRPFTQDEQYTVEQVTQRQPMEAGWHLAHYLEYRRGMNKAQRELNRFLDPFVERLIEKHLSAIVEDMTATEQDELERLLHAVDGSPLMAARYAY
ncbi:hypothetical protein AB0O05_05400 [Streptomyces sp. NPDC093084]|uniref:hypothetical protein n=1 Tax=Streptomyces sp. NPDC093084 TaxID=3155197 RepID=UPI003420A6F4